MESFEQFVSEMEMIEGPMEESILSREAKLGMAIDAILRDYSNLDATPHLFARVV